MTIPRYLPILTALTCVYLAFELAFNARLLDVAGGDATTTQIESIEVWGRRISGLAFALAICGMRLMPLAEKQDWPLPKQLSVLGLVALVSVAAVFVGEKALVDWLANTSSGRARSIAARLEILTHSFLTHDATLDGIDLNREEMTRPEGKALLALLPVLAFATNDLDRKAHDATNEIVRNLATSQMHSPQRYYDDVFIPSANGMRDAYNKYAEASNALARALDQIPAQQDKAWSQYVDRLARNRWTPASVPGFAWNRVRQDVQRQGVSVLGNWAPGDQRSFYDAIRRQIETEAWNSFNGGVARLLDGTKLPPGLSLDAFLAQPPIQDKWRRELHIDQPAFLRLKESVTDFTALSYAPTLDHLVREKMANYEGQDTSFANGGSHDESGRSAMRALLVPPIALMFSLLGGILHIGKLFDCVGRFLPGPRRVKAVLIFGTLGFAILAVFWKPNPVSTSRVFGSFQQQIAADVGWPLERALTWVVQAQPFAYPVNEAIRRSLPGNVTYGYAPKQAKLAQKED